MLSVKSKILVLAACLLETLWLLFAQVLNNPYILIPCLMCFLALTAWTAIKSMALPVLLFFLPFSALLKIRPGTVSFYTIALLMVYLIYIVMGSKKINVYHLIPALVLISMLVVVKTVFGYPFRYDFIMFSASLLVAPFLCREMNDNKYDFYWLTVVFSLGIILAAISARYFIIFPTIARYVRKLSLFGVVRYAGYYGDPNFYSSHVTAALSGVMVLLLNNLKKGRAVTLVLLMMVLLYCGFLSVSKSFLLIVLCLMLFWGVAFMFKKGKLTMKVTIILSLIVGAVFLLSFTAFTDLIDMMIQRLTSGKTLSDFTTGRTELWSKYIQALTEDSRLLLFGVGYTNVMIDDRGSHNTLLQIVYQMGIVGGVGLIAWVICYVRILMADAKIRWGSIVQMGIILVGTIGPWMALDFLFFDEFFLIPIFVCFALRFLSERESIQSA